MTYHKYIFVVSLPYLAAMLAVTPLPAQTVTAPLPPGLSAQRSYVLSRTVTAAPRDTKKGTRGIFETPAPISATVFPANSLSFIFRSVISFSGLSV